MHFFDYANLPTGDWTAHLQELNRVSSRGVLVRVFWGDHESLQGVRDFHSKSRLKLEKVCALAHSLQIPLHFRFGFSVEKRSFPEWTRQLLPQALVSRKTEDDLISRWEFIRIPSFRNDEVRKGFVSFLSEALSILSLHRAPEGSVQSASFDWGSLISDSCPMDPTFIEHELAQRYGSIERFNSLFQTSFNNFQAVSKPTGLKTIMAKRPWIAFWEYKSLKAKAFQIWEGELKAIFEQTQLPWISSSTPLAPVGGVNNIVIDDTLLELNDDQSSFHPVLVQGETDPNSLRAFRVAEMLKIEAASFGEKLSWLSSWTPTAESKVCVFICSKFISRRAYTNLNSFIESGGKVVFPLGIPKWDENMESLQWKLGSLSEQPWEVKENFYEKLRECFV
ncbi:MAG: hypothetical protein EBQ92_11935 [Proteobacteria bacterium]|nr:hypothetical protein [Pseudomonadota bacterium]